MILYKIFRDSAENEVWKQKFKIIFILMQLSEMHGGFIVFIGDQREDEEKID